MKFGYACIPLGSQYKTTRKFILKNFNEEILINCIRSNLYDLHKILEYNLNHNIRMFRISSDIIPFGSHEINNFNWIKYFSKELLEIGNFVNKNNIRLSMHPGQYTVLNSLDSNILKRSIDDLQYHANFLDSLNLNKEHKLILHVGGVYGDKDSALKRFISNYNDLDSSIKNRLIIENDERNFSLYDLFKISNSINAPIVLDNLHYFCMEQKIHSYKDLIDTFSTWTSSDGIPKVHYSEQEPGKRTGSHSNTIHIKQLKSYLEISQNLNFDIMIEVKDKDFSAFKATNFSNKISDKNSLHHQLDVYKYFLLEKSQDTLEKGKEILFNLGIENFYEYLDSIEYLNNQNSLNTLKEFSKEFILKSTEKNYLEKLFLSEDTFKIKSYLLKLALRGSNENLLQNYFLFT